MPGPLGHGRPGPVRPVPVECTDTGPAYEQSEAREFIGNDPPSNGTVTQEDIGDPIVYTPNAGFIGADSFGYGVFDKGGFGWAARSP